MTFKTIVLGDQAVNIDPASEVHVESYKAMHNKTVADHAAKVEAKDKEIGELKAKLKIAEDKANINVDALVEKRSAFIAKVNAIDSTIDCSGKSDAQIMREVVSAKLAITIPDSESDDVVRGMFAVVSSDADPVRKAISSGVKKASDSAAQMNDAWNKSVDDMNSWRNK